MELFKKCQRRSFMMGTVNLISAGALVFFACQVIKRKKIYRIPENVMITAPIVSGITVAFFATRRYSQRCHQFIFKDENQDAYENPAVMQVSSDNAKELS